MEEILAEWVTFRCNFQFYLYACANDVGTGTFRQKSLLLVQMVRQKMIRSPYLAGYQASSPSFDRVTW
jgi:hypothetical protein